MDHHTEIGATISNSTSGGATGPGAILQAARKAKKLSLADVAKRLRLSLQCVKDIENDDYTHGVALIYIRGYLRSYARLVETSPSNVIDAFETMNLEKKFKRAKSDKEKIMFQQMEPIPSKQTRFISWRATRWISSVVVLILVVLVAMWWQGQRKYTLYSTNQAQLQQPRSSKPVQKPAQDAEKVQAKAPNQMAVSQQSAQQQK